MLLSRIVIHSLDIFSIVNILVAIVLLLISAMLSGAEIAYFSLKSEDIKEIEKQSDVRNRLTIRHLNKPKKFLIKKNFN